MLLFSLICDVFMVAQYAIETDAAALIEAIAKITMAMMATRGRICLVEVIFENPGEEINMRSGPLVKVTTTVLEEG